MELPARQIAWNLVKERLQLSDPPEMQEICDGLERIQLPTFNEGQADEELEVSLLLSKLLAGFDDGLLGLGAQEEMAQGFAEIGMISQLVYDLYSSIEGPMFVLDMSE